MGQERAELPKAVVARRRPKDDTLLAELFPGWQIVSPGDPLAGRCFGRILVTCDPTAIPFSMLGQWFNQLSTHMRPGQFVEWLA